MDPEFFYVGCDAAILLNQLREETGELEANATIVGQMFCCDQPIGGAITFSPVSGTPGSYQSVIPASFDLIAGSLYTLEITVSFVGGLTAKFEMEREARVIEI